MECLLICSGGMLIEISKFTTETLAFEHIHSSGSPAPLV